MTHIPDKLRQFVQERAGGRCEYCLFLARYAAKRYEIDHIVAEQHGGLTIESNLCFSCGVCNRYKGTNLSSIDPQTEAIVQLFNPRQDKWEEHFRLQGAYIEGLTPQGRATVRLLHMNDSDNVIERERLIRLRLYP